MAFSVSNHNICCKNSDNGFTLFLIYRIEIDKIDYKSSIIKKNMNFAEIVETKPIYVNEQVKELFRTRQLYCPMAFEPFVDTIYTEYNEDGYFIKAFFYKIRNCELLTQKVITEGEAKNLATGIHRTINLLNNLISDYDKYYSVELDNIIKELSKPRFYIRDDINVFDFEGKYLDPLINEFPLKEILKFKLFDYQKDNLNWMLNLEANPLSDYFSSDKLLFFPDGRIFNYSKNEFITNDQRQLVKLKGGIVLDEVGVGKTLQFLCLAVSNSSINTLCLVPDHLESHWQDQWIKHFNIPIPSNIQIFPFSKLNSGVFSRYKIDRLIIDEIHELYSNSNYSKIFEMVLQTNCNFKWGISATPFPVAKSIYHLIRYLTEKTDLYYENMDRFLHFYDTYYKMFRKNTKDNIVSEIVLPPSIEHNLLLEFNSHERLLYDAEIQAKNNCDMDFLRKCCCDAMINYTNGSQIISLQDFHNLIINDYKNKYINELKKYNQYVESHNNCIKNYKKFSPDFVLLGKKKFIFYGILTEIDFIEFDESNQSAKSTTKLETCEEDVENVLNPLINNGQYDFEYDEHNNLMELENMPSYFEESKSNSEILDHDKFNEFEPNTGKINERKNNNKQTNVIDHNYDEKLKYESLSTNLNESKEQESFIERSIKNVNLKINRQTNEFAFTDVTELLGNIEHYKNKIRDQLIIVNDRKKSFEFLLSKINEENKECPVCLSEITDDCEYDVPECGHIYCHSCLIQWLSLNSSCSVCRSKIDKTKLYTVTNLSQVKMKYSTKIDKLIEIITQNPNEKFIIYTQFDNMIDKLIKTLKIENIGSIKLTDPSDIAEFRNNPDNRVIVLSSVKNASGIDLSFCANIIIFEPIIGDTLFLKDIEKQIIGRIYRIGQTRSINVYRFIIKDTIEERIFNNAHAN